MIDSLARWPAWHVVVVYSGGGSGCGSCFALRASIFYCPSYFRLVVRASVWVLGIASREEAGNSWAVGSS